MAKQNRLIRGGNSLKKIKHFEEKKLMYTLTCLQPQYTTQLFVKLFAATIGLNQSGTPIHSIRYLIFSRQRMLQTVARRDAYCIVSFVLLIIFVTTTLKIISPIIGKAIIGDIYMIFIFIYLGDIHRQIYNKYSHRLRRFRDNSLARMVL